MANYIGSGKTAEFEKIELITSDGNAATSRRAFAVGDKVRFTVKAPDGTVSAVMCIKCDDDDTVTELKMACSGGVFRTEICTDTLCGADGGLFFYKYVFTTPRGEFETHRRKLDAVTEIRDASDGFEHSYTMLVYNDRHADFDWLHGGTMYQIFVDRFCRGGNEKPRADAVMHKSWDENPMYAERGMPILNNDFFGGDLAGIEQKLPYLKSLGVSIIYLNPIFSAYSNHKYDTADYMQVDEMFGGNEALDSLIDSAKKCGISIILDGVFNHTGSDSVYFNKKGKYSSVGAYQSKKSPYYRWYNFTSYPDKYESWWGIDIHPRVKCDDETYREFICGENGVVRSYIRRGIAGWRLDVADELSDSFLAELRSAAAEENPSSLVIGEVWENAVTKVSYGNRRKYFRGHELDSVMNYPMRRAIIDYVRDGDFMMLLQTVDDIYSSYPKWVCDCMMNILGTHDTLRLLTALGGMRPSNKKKSELVSLSIPQEKLDTAYAMQRLAYTLLASLPGVPCIFYGDEVGMQGYDDPFCRRTYPWGLTDEKRLALRDYYALIGRIRNENKDIFADGEFALPHVDYEIACAERIGKTDMTVTVINRSDRIYTFSADKFTSLIDGSQYIMPMSAGIFRLPRGTEYSVFEKITVKKDR